MLEQSEKVLSLWDVFNDIITWWQRCTRFILVPRLFTSYIERPRTGGYHVMIDIISIDWIDIDWCIWCWSSGKTWCNTRNLKYVTRRKTSQINLTILLHSFCFQNRKGVGDDNNSHPPLAKKWEWGDICHSSHDLLHLFPQVDNFCVASTVLQREIKSWDELGCRLEFKSDEQFWSGLFKRRLALILD